MSSHPSSSSSPSVHLTSHPLLDDEPSPRAGRRTPRRERAAVTEAPSSSGSGYFTLKARLESDSRAGSGNWEGSVRGRGTKTASRASPSTHRGSLPALWDAQAPTPVVVVDTAASGSATNDDELYNDIATAVSGGSDPDSVSRILATPWHTLPDSSMYSALDEQGQPQYAVLRTLSAATERLFKLRSELEESRRVLQEKEDARRARGNALLEELPQSERDIARRVLASLFTRDDEEGHHVVRRQSRISLADTISEAMGEEVLSTSAGDDAGEALTTAATRVKSAPTVLETIDSVPSTPMPDDPTPATARPAIESETSTDTEVGLPDIDETVFPEAQVEVEPASDASSLPSSRSRSQDTRSVVSARSERSVSGVGEWMGTLWGRRKPKEMDTESDSNASKDEAQSVEPERSRSAPSLQISTSSSSAVDDAEKAAKESKGKEGDRTRRSVFGTLGLSLLAGSGVRKKRPALSADFTPPPSGPPTAVDSTFPTEITSPDSEVAQPSITPATAPALPTTTSSPAESMTATSVERPPQGAVIPALVAATRVMTADASSILIDIDVTPSVAAAAQQLIQHVRDTGLDVRKAARPRQHKRKSSLAAKLQQLQVPGKEDMGVPEKEAPNKRLSVAATMASVLPASGFASPLLGSFLPQQRRVASNAPVASSSGQAQATEQPAPPPLRSVALDAIIPATARPPTAYLSREYSTVTVHDARGDLRPTLTQHISSFRPAYVHHMSSSRVARSGEGGVLADRFGFTYDAGTYDLLLLLRARATRCAAPACLTGVRIADRSEDPEASDEEDAAAEASIDVVQGACSCNGSFERDADAISVASGVSGKSKKEGKDGKEKDGKRDWHTVLTIAPDTPRHVCHNVMQSLLNELSTIHDSHQDARRKEWDAFLVQRARATQSASASVPRLAAGGNGGFPRGLDTSDAPADELAHSEGVINVNALPAASRKELARLARAGVPLALRAKVWLECTGALEMREPGVFDDLLAESGDPAVEGEIEKDVGRTMPLNLFFGGDGAGVAKLRRVLVAYSRRNPAVGYCQGMNLLAATLLLVHAAEEDAFWAFTAILERVLPTGFFSPTLLPSRACPLVLLELVREHLPKLFTHLQELGIDLPAICFSWFLSLLTDCLPIETLFRAWDVLIVDGFDVLFRLALSILRIGEPELLACASVPAAYVALESLPTRMWEADRLLQMEAEMRASVGHAEVVKRRNAHVQVLEAALG